MADEKDPAHETHAYLTEWLDLDDKQRALRPTVVRMASSALWQMHSMDALRDESPHMAAEIDSDLAHSLAALKVILPLPEKYNDAAIFTGSAVSTQANARVFEALVSAGGSGPHSVHRLTDQVKRYEELQAEQQRADEAGRRVALLFPNISERFATAQDAARLAGNDPKLEEAAAFEMRTFLEKFKGELFNKARRHPGENMTWDRMAGRLSGQGVQSLVNEDASHRSLHDTLSRIGKARTAAFAFSEVWARFIDHVFIVCGQALAVSGKGAVQLPAVQVGARGGVEDPK